MKMIQPMLLAAVLLSPFGAAAQTPRPDGSGNTDETSTTETEGAGRTGATRTEPGDTGSRNMPGMSRNDAGSDKYHDELRTEISEVKKEVEDLRGRISDQGTEKFTALSTRVDELESRITTVGDERAFKENKHKFKNELKKIRRELKCVRKYQTGSS